MKFSLNIKREKYWTRVIHKLLFVQKFKNLKALPRGLCHSRNDISAEKFVEVNIWLLLKAVYYVSYFFRLIWNFQCNYWLVHLYWFSDFELRFFFEFNSTNYEKNQFSNMEKIRSIKKSKWFVFCSITASCNGKSLK